MLLQLSSPGRDLTACYMPACENHGAGPGRSIPGDRLLSGILCILPFLRRGRASERRHGTYFFGGAETPLGNFCALSQPHCTPPMRLGWVDRKRSTLRIVGSIVFFDTFSCRRVGPPVTLHPLAAFTVDKDDDWFSHLCVWLVLGMWRWASTFGVPIFPREPRVGKYPKPRR